MYNPDEAGREMRGDIGTNEGVSYANTTITFESDIELAAYRVIRQFAQSQKQCEINHILNNKERDTQDRALGNFVRGVVSLQSELYSKGIN